MASRVKPFARRTAAEHLAEEVTAAIDHAKASKSAKPLPPVPNLPPRRVLLRLAPLVAPHRGKGRLLIRVEGLPQRATLSQGRNNGNGSWSLAQDEIDAVEFVAPHDARPTPSLVVRIIGLEQDGATLAVLDLPLTPGAAPDIGEAPNDGTARALREDLETARALLKDREAEIADLRRTLAQASERDASSASLESELARKLEAASIEAARALDSARRSWQAEEAERIVAREAQWRETSEKAEAAARVELRNQNSSELERAKREWSAGETERLAAAEKRWRDQASKSSDATLSRTQAMLGERDRELARARQLLAEEQQRHGRELADAVARTREETKAAEARKLTDAESQWRTTSANDVAGLTARAEKAEAALAAAERDAQARAQGGDAELARLREDCGALQVRCDKAETALAIAERDAQARAQGGDAELARLREDRAALQVRCDRAETSLAIAERDAQARAQGGDAELARLREDRAALQARCDKAEAALAIAERDAQARAKDTGDSAQLAGLRSDLVALGAKYKSLEADRAADTAKAEAALAAARTAWKSEEDGRLALAEEKWRHKSEAKLAEASRKPSETYDDALIAQLRGEIASLQQSLADREIELAQARLAMEARHIPYPAPTRPLITLEKSRPPRERTEPSASRPFVRDVVLVSVCVMVIVLALPFLTAYLPYSWQYEIAETTQSVEDMFGSEPDAAPPPARKVAAPAIVTAKAVVRRAANMRSTPSTFGTVVGRLKAGETVETHETKDGWTFVKANGVEGWVFATLLAKPAGN